MDCVFDLADRFNQLTLGLKNGDIIKFVNNNPMTDPAQALKLFEQLKSERSIGVKVERIGQDVDLSYSIR